MRCFAIASLALLCIGSATTHSATPADHSALEAALRDVAPQVVAWRRDIHEHPELSNRETRTAALVAAELQRLGMQVKTGIAHTGVTGLLRGGRPGPTVALRADMDALPVTEKTDVPFRSRVTAEFNGQQVGVMHACGHDTHVAMLLGVARALAQVRASLPGSVLFVFQPAEEGPPAGEEGGAALMLKEGLFASQQKPAAIFGLHVLTQLTAGTLGYRSGPHHAAVDSWRVLVQGRQTHGSMPWQGVDPIVAAAQIVTALQTVVSRRVDIRGTPVVVSVGAIHGGVRHNIIPESVEMLGTIRSFTPEHRQRIFGAMQEIVENTARAAGATARLELGEPSYPATVNDPALTARMAPTLQRVAGEGKLLELPLITAAEDFSYFAQQVPAFYFIVGITPPGKDPAAAPANHSDYFFVDEAALPLGTRAMANLALDFLRGGNR